ncbi:aminotransferase class V-fold PLP-dependent enzyme [Vannielia litorea]|uniref:aminotransferase class V-fold PLP-dependent enzyme n=1 Tax=Vannielia litorea TaxID=1217970 RepID=UPI001C956C83|nr:aminotransferase class V-fold PLP-dependent enzyme [Vannielia litorea]MBY6049254.1 aminotransferase class V-fold PLP-dependent enzyme [Vannielia litorea]MBY6076668.1 aminotransferase class V-fold PLP-dependent enzyme [Vannielia litorea]
MLGNNAGLIDEVRARFAHVESDPFTGERIFFENAGGALTLKSVVATSATFAAIPDNQGRDNPMSAHLVTIIAKVKADAACFLNSSGGQVIVGESGTELLFRLARAACNAWKGKGGKVISSTMEHPASRSAAALGAEAAGLEHIVVAHDDASGTVGPDAYAAAMSPDVRVATIVHASPVTGMGMDVAAIAAAIRAVSPGCTIIVDGIQHAAHGHVDVAAAGVDGYVVSPYKMFARHGFGLAWLSDRLAACPHDTLQGGGSWEMGTRDTGAYAAFSDVIDYFTWLGEAVGATGDQRAKIEAAAKAIHAHEWDLTEAMLRGTDNQKGLTELPGVTVLGGADNPAREGLVSLVVKGMTAEALVSELRVRGIRTHARKADHYSGNVLTPLGYDGCLRVSLCHYNTEGEVASFLAAMAEITGA